MIAALTFDCVRGIGPVYLNQVICQLRRSRAHFTSIGQRSFSMMAHVVWNALPPDLSSPHNSRNSSDRSWKLIFFAKTV